MPIRIADAKKVCEVGQVRAVLIVSFDGRGNFGTTSYGVTVAECKALAAVNERIHQLVLDGVIVIPDSLAGGRT